MKKMLVFVLITCMLLYFQSVQAYRLTDNLYFAMPNNTIECIDIILPDDSGFMGMGEFEYRITCSSNWSDLTEQIVRTDENNTAKIPICFSGFGRANGDCSPPFNITISSQLLGIKNEWDAGVCISRYPDYDIADEEPEDEDDVRDIINGNVDLFDVGFSPEILHAEPEKQVTYSLMVESYATLTIDLEVKNAGFPISPTSEVVKTSPFDPHHKIDFNLDTPAQNREYEFDVEANIRNCQGSFCRKTARGKLIVNDTLPETGFLAYIFPKNLNVKSLDPVIYMLTIQNYEKDRTFSTSINIDPTTATDFQPGSVAVSADSYKTVEFTVTPQDVSSLYLIELTVSFEGLEKKVTASLSTNEMLTDAMRNADYISSIDPSLSNDANSALDDWYNSYKSSNYGSDLNEYKSLKETFSDLENQTSVEPPETNGIYIPSEPANGYEEEYGWLWTVIPIVIIVVVVIILYMFFKKSEKTEEGEGEYF